MVGTVSCRLYLVDGLATNAPSLVLAHNASQSGCWVPVVVGNYWVQPNSETKQVFSLDVHDPRSIREVSVLKFDDRQRPHWLATDGRRIVIVNDANGENRMWMARLDGSTGSLVLDDAFRNPDSNEPGFSFNQQSGRMAPAAAPFRTGQSSGDSEYPGLPNIALQPTALA